MIKFLNPIINRSILTDMFKEAYRYLIFLLVIVTIVSCNKEENAGQKPSIELIADSGFISESSSASPGELMNFKVVAKEGSEKLTNFFIEVITIDGDITRYFDTAIYCSEFHWEGSFYKSAVLHEEWIFAIQDRQSNRAGSFIFINADTNAAYGPIESISNINLGAQNNPEKGGFFSLMEQQIYFALAAKENQEKIDMVFYLGEDEMTMACPDANIESGIFPSELTPSTWDVRNTTRYIKTSLTSSDFDAAQNDSILIANYVDASAKRKAKNLVTGDIVVFKNHQNILGMFRVNSISGTDEGDINIDIKIQE